MTEKDYRRFYQELTAFLGKWQSGQAVVVRANKILTKGVYALYPIVLLRTGLGQDWPTFWRQTCYPALGFALVSWGRKRLNQPRPYERWDISPLIAKDTVGQSFPSRHVFSASIIGTVALVNQPILGGLIVLVAVCLAVLRVLGGVHYPRDVLAGLLLGILLGLPVFFW